jgi:hypothetical protein
VRSKNLEDLKTEFRQISERARELVGPLNPGLLERRPKPQSWSVAECLAHLNVSADAYFPIWERELDQARKRLPAARTDTYRMDFWGRILFWTLEPPPKFRFPAPANFQPVNTGPTEKILPDFLARQKSILEMLDRSRGLPIDKIKIASPFDRRVHYNIWSSFCVTAAHERRHLWQAERAAKDLIR